MAKPPPHPLKVRLLLTVPDTLVHDTGTDAPAGPANSLHGVTSQNEQWPLSIAEAGLSTGSVAEKSRIVVVLTSTIPLEG